MDCEIKDIQSSPMYARPNQARQNKAHNETSDQNVVKVRRDEMLALTNDSKLDLGEMGLVYRLVLLVDWNSNILFHPLTHRPITVTEFADLAGLPHRDVSFALTRLEALGLVRTLTNGVSFDRLGDKIMLNPALAWRGDGEAQAREVRLFQAGQKRRAEMEAGAL